MGKIPQRSTYRATNELCFFSVATSPLGRLLAGGVGRKGQLNNWWNIEHPKKTSSNYYLVMMLQDSGGFYSNENGFECSLQYGDFFIAFPGQKIRYAPGATEIWSELCVAFEGTAFDLLQQPGLLSPHTPVWQLNNPKPWLGRLQTMLHATRPASTLEVAREATQFLALLLEMLEAASHKTAAPATSDWFDRACVMLSSDLSQPPRLKQIATELDMSYDTFRRNFRQRAGLSPGKYFDKQRCQEAQDRLVKTQIPCWELAHYLGFCDEQHFSRRFKEWTGLSPRNYRSHHQTLNQTQGNLS